MMARTCFMLFVLIFPRIDSELCILKTESGKEKSVCCADYEAKHNDCIPCPKGYTSYAGQNCRPCSHNTYGERCRYDCSCSDFEVCNIVHGCVLNKTTIGISVEDTFDHSIYTVTKQTSTNEKLSREIITYYTLSLTGTVFGVWLCFLFYKYKTVISRPKTTLVNSKTRSIRQSSQDIEMDGSLYDIINDTDMLDNQSNQQLEISSDFVDVVNDIGSHSTVSIESNYQVKL